jgi:Pyruvate/2-oxoglutarate dehydrogenase complex, dihydrolipoamide dehydrogenase (E3) component, and related enzymes
MREYDLIIIGSGAGLMVMEEGLKNGLSCAVIERGKMGGTCLTKGCIPSKMLVYPADFIRESQDSERFGVASTKPVPDWKKISERVWEQIDFHIQIEDSLNQIPGLTVYKGTASFEDSHTIRVDYGDRREPDFIRGEKIVIATGARSFVPGIPGLEETGYLTSETFFGKKYPDHPWKSLIILGSGAISAEFAHIFSAMGTEVTLVARSGRILKQEEDEVSSFVQDRFAPGRNPGTDRYSCSISN